MSKPQSSALLWWVRWLDNIDRRVIYVFVALSLTVPIVMGLVLPPVPLPAATSFHQVVDALEPQPGKIVLIASDWGPGTKAENKVQTELAIEHLMRKRIPFALISITALATPFLRDVPLGVAERLEKEFPGEKWSYGQDWVNFGFQFGSISMIQSIARSKNILEEIKTDAKGTPLEDIACLEGVETIHDISMLMEFTGLVGAFNNWLQFFQSENYVPPFVHGCTSISVPEAHIYLASKQIIGLLEGLAGAAAYDKLLSDANPAREPGKALKHNTGLSIAQILILVFMLLGNIGYGLSLLVERRGKS